MAFTPEEIAQILEEFFATVGTRQYIGARYVPIFGRKDEQSIEWDNSKPYEPLTIVLYQGNSFTSRQYVPAGVAITNTEFWAVTGNYNAQVEQYRRETQAAAQAAAAAQESADAAQRSADAAQEDIDLLLPKSAFDSTNTVEAAINAAQRSADAAQNDIDLLLPKSAFSENDTILDHINALGALLPTSDFNSTDTVKKYVDSQLAANALNTYHPLTYLGRIVPFAHWGYRYGQGICLLDDKTALVSCTSTNNALAYVYRVDLEAGVVVDVMQSNIGHANDMFYDAAENVVLVAPASIAGSPSNDILVCSPTTMSILSTHTLDIRPSCVFKYDGSYYVCAIQSSIVSLYRYDANFTNSELVATIPAVETGNRSVAQIVRIYNNVIYVLYGGYQAQAIYAFDMTGNITGRIDFGRTIEYFNVTEFEAFDITSDGDFIIYAQTSIAGQYSLYCNAIFGLNVSGKLLNPVEVVERYNVGSNLHVSNIENNYNRFIRPIGTSSLPFPSVEEAVACSCAGGSANIILDTDAYWAGYAPLASTANGNVSLNGNSKTLYAGLPFSDVNLDGGMLFGVMVRINNALIKSSAITRNKTLRFSGCNFWLYGSSKINFENSDNVAPLRFDQSVVAIDSSVTRDGEGTSRSLLMNGSLLVTPNDTFSYSGQLARVQ